MQNDPNDAAGGMPSSEQGAQPVPEAQLSESVYQEYPQASAPERPAEPVKAASGAPSPTPASESAPVDTPPPGTMRPTPQEEVIAPNAWPIQANGDEATLRGQHQSEPQQNHVPAAPQQGAPGVFPQPGYAPALPQQATPGVFPQQGYVPATPGYVPGTFSQGYVPVTPQPVPAGTFPQGYAPPAFPAGYVPPVAQPGYVPPMPQPGYVSPTLQPGYVPSMSQPGYAPPALPPNYVTAPLPQGYAPGTFPPGYVPPMQPQPPRQPRERPGWLAIAGVVLAVLVLLAIILVAVSRIALPNTGIGSKPGATPTTAPGHPTSAFQAAKCPFQVGTGITEGQQLSCGYVTVPENRAKSNSGKVRLAVAIFKAPQYMNTVDPAPVLRLDGGPGGPSLDNWAKFVTSADYSQLIFDHDVIMFDQRGTGYSTPSLQCKELIQLQYSTSDVGAQNYEQQARACHDRLVSQGIDLSGFNTLQNAADVSDLIHALGYQKMTIYGVSYGTRLALTVMRLYPGVVHGAILDSVYPTNHNRNDLPADAQRVFNVLFQGCAKDPNCNAKYPNLQSVFYSLVDTLNAHPVSYQTTDQNTGNSYTVPLSGGDLVGWLFSSLYGTQLIPLLPQTIFQVQAHNYSQISRIEGLIGFDSTFSDGMFYSVECSEDWPFLTQQDITKSEQGITPQISAVFGSGEQQEYNVCQFWNVQKVPAVQKQAVVSSLPTLVLSGEYDPITPPSNGQETANHLSNSYFFTFPGQGHGQQYSSDCSDSIINAFENDPSQKPSDACITQMAEPAFQ